jgi:hypothetical protein
MADEILRGLNLVLAALLGGGMAFELLVVLPVARRLDPPTVVTFHHALAGKSVKWALATGPAAAVIAIVLLIRNHDFGHAQAWLLLAGLVVISCGAVVTGGPYRLLHEKTGKLDAGVDVEGEVVRPWAHAQLMRTILYVATLCCFIAAAVTA